LQDTYFFEDFTGTQKVLLGQTYTVYFNHKVHKVFTQSTQSRMFIYGFFI